ncbi:helix-turn-helix transcriptional regulator [Sphingobacterium sp. 40-24]|uniref:AraC family transcriptional regulator n=1 Tax=Sphingobacterium sp. 40-24 TaxID=1895843 RepID=UPI00095D2FD5|nr:helix-turn-helix transcriptional regulator [Sphingobacterium sp. 40-24]OJZ14435.1 MAG: AraC family transcriptional regulator [Sphingobacterium sp. 40-24]
MNRKNTIPIIDSCSIDLNNKTTIHIDDLKEYIIKHQDMVFPHKHNFFHFVLFTKGSGEHIIDFNHYNIEPYQIYFMVPGQVHTWNFTGDEEGYVVNFSIDYFQSFLLRTDYLERFSFLQGKIEQLIFVIAEQFRKQAIHILEQIASAKAVGQSEDYIRTLLLQFILYISISTEKDHQEHSTPYNHKIFNSFQQLVEQQFRSTKLPSVYADQLFITPNHLNAICKSYIGQSAGEIIRNRIVLEAKRLLVNRNLNINEIADELQFNDNSYFTKFFKKSAGLTPEEFRKQL